MSDKKFLRTLPIFHKNKFIIDFKRKTNIFNNFFVTQCKLVKNTRTLFYWKANTTVSADERLHKELY